MGQGALILASPRGLRSSGAHRNCGRFGGLFATAFAAVLLRQHGLIAAHPENKCHRCETMVQHPELIWIKTVHVLACVEIKILRRVVIAEK